MPVSIPLYYLSYEPSISLHVQTRHVWLIVTYTDFCITCSIDTDSHMTFSTKTLLFINCMQLQGFLIDFHTLPWVRRMIISQMYFNTVQNLDGILITKHSPLLLLPGVETSTLHILVLLKECMANFTSQVSKSHSTTSRPSPVLHTEKLELHVW